MLDKILYFGTIVLHWGVVVGMTLAVPLSIIQQPWYMALVVFVVVLRTATSPTECPLSTLECYFARKLKYPEKNKFIKHHVLPAIKHFKKYILKIIDNFKK